jgi:predicted O-methyltransferase YrrM
MKPEQVRQILQDTPHMRLRQAYRITELIHQNKIKDVIELGFAHGVSTCYMAAALQEAGGGSITTIDLESARCLCPNVEQLLEKCGYAGMVDVCYEPTSYTWRLMKFLENDVTPRFDLCYVDGAHDWFVDGFAFFLIDRLLRVGGWIIFDDLDWTFATSPSLHSAEWVKSMPQDERETPQIRKVYELLVRTHPCYSDFRVQEGWAYAHKVSASVARSARIRRETVYITHYEPLTLRNVVSCLKRATISRLKRPFGNPAQ